MVSNARDDLPLPEIPVITTKQLRGIETLMSFRLCVRAPKTSIKSGSRAGWTGCAVSVSGCFKVASDFLLLIKEARNYRNNQDDGRFIGGEGVSKVKGQR